MTLPCRANQLAPWVNVSLTATELDKALKNHITTIMNHYHGKLYAWDVIVRPYTLSGESTKVIVQNEMISDNTPTETFKNNIWTQKFGEEAMPKALKYARAVDKQPKL